MAFANDIDFWMRKPSDYVGLPPNDIEAEGSVLGYLIFWHENASRALDFLDSDVGLKTEDFYSYLHRHVWEAIQALRSAGKPIHKTTIRTELQRAGKLAELNDAENPDYLETLSRCPAPTLAAMAECAFWVQQRARERALVRLCHSTLAASYNRKIPIPQSHLEGFEKELRTILEQRRGVRSGDTRALLRSVVTDLVKGKPDATLTTGIEAVDFQLNGGLRATNLVILGARSGLGKSSLGFGIASDVAASRQGGVLIVSQEMPREEVMQRILSRTARIPLEAIVKRRVIGNADWTTNIGEAAKRINDWPIVVRDERYTTQQIRAMSREADEELQRRFGIPLALVVVDHLSLIQLPNTRDPLQERLGQAANDLKSMAKELRVCVLALAQLNRSLESRQNKDKRPQLSDLRDSGKVEEAADVVLMLYRPSYYSHDHKDTAAEMLIAKARNGRTGRVEMQWVPERASFEGVKQW